jgi:hypothetical protein
MIKHSKEYTEAMLIAPIGEEYARRGNSQFKSGIRAAEGITESGRDESRKARQKYLADEGERRSPDMLRKPTKVLYLK